MTRPSLRRRTSGAIAPPGAGATDVHVSVDGAYASTVEVFPSLPVPPVTNARPSLRRTAPADRIVFGMGATVVQAFPWAAFGSKT